MTEYPDQWAVILGLVIAIVLVLGLLFTLISWRERQFKTIATPITLNESNLWQYAHPFEAEVQRILSILTKAKIMVLSQNLNSAVDMITHNSRGYVDIVIKCLDMPSKQVPQIWLDKLIVTRDRNHASKAILVTTGYFSRETRVDADENGVILISGQDFYKLQQKYPKDGEAPKRDPHERYMRPQR
jgi:hypothetical protein